MAPFVVALGPGFTAGVDADVVIETMRGHKLGRLIYEGRAMENTGTPGLIGGKGKERVIHSSKAGFFKGNKEIGDIVEEGDVVAYVDDEPRKRHHNGSDHRRIEVAMPQSEREVSRHQPERGEHLPQNRIALALHLEPSSANRADHAPKHHAEDALRRADPPAVDCEGDEIRHRPDE